MGDLVRHVDQLRRLAQLDPETSVFDLAVVNVLEEIAAAVDRLVGDNEPPGFESI